MYDLYMFSLILMTLGQLYDDPRSLVKLIK